MIEIEDNIPIPTSTRGERTTGVKYPFEELEVNQSFLVPNPNNLPLSKVKNQVNSLSNYFGKKHSRRFIIRTTIEGIRVWRSE